MPGEARKYSLLRIGGVTLAVVALTALVLLYHDFAREPSESERRRKTFEVIYAEQGWGTGEQGKGTSGAGSTLEFTKLYRVFLQDFLAEHQIRSVVDAGCGDWEFSRAIDWKGIDYLGLDIVAPVVEANQRRFGGPNIRFAVADIVRDELPPADLLLVKDVLQHLSNADIARLFAQLPRYRHVLIVNDVRPDSLTGDLKDIPSGHFRAFDPTQPPHSLPGTKVLAWRHGAHTKLVVHVRPR